MRYSLVLLLVLCVIGCTEKKEHKKGAGDTEKEQAIAVRTLQVKKGTISRYLELSATIDARYRVEVFPKIEGEVLDVLKEEGAKVEKGEVLARLERKHLELEKKDAELNLQELYHQLSQQELTLREATQDQKTAEIDIEELKERANSAQIRLKKMLLDLKRSKNLFEKEAISSEVNETSQLSYQEARSALNSAKLAIEKARASLLRHELTISHAKLQLDVLNNRIKQANLAVEKVELRIEDADIRAPITGIISYHEIQVGQRLTPSIHVFTVMDCSHLEIEVGIPERELPLVKKGQPVRLFCELVPLKKESKPQGKVFAISPVVRKETGTVKVTIDLIGPTIFRPGMFVTAQIITATHTQAVLVPKKALLFDDNVPFLFLERNKRAKKIALTEKKVGFTDKFHYEVLEGIEPNDQVIVVGQAGLKENALVRVVSGTGPGG